MGISRRTILSSLALESLAIALAGGVAGVALGLLVSRGINAYFQRYYQTDLVFSAREPRRRADGRRRRAAAGRGGRGDRRRAPAAEPRADAWRAMILFLAWRNLAAPARAHAPVRARARGLDRASVRHGAAVDRSQVEPRARARRDRLRAARAAEGRPAVLERRRAAARSGAGGRSGARAGRRAGACRCGRRRCSCRAGRHARRRRVRARHRSGAADDLSRASRAGLANEPAAPAVDAAIPIVLNARLADTLGVAVGDTLIASVGLDATGGGGRAAGAARSSRGIAEFRLDAPRPASAAAPRSATCSALAGRADEDPASFVLGTPRARRRRSARGRRVWQRAIPTPTLYAVGRAADAGARAAVLLPAVLAHPRHGEPAGHVPARSLTLLTLSVNERQGETRDPARARSQGARAWSLLVAGRGLALARCSRSPPGSALGRVGVARARRDPDELAGAAGRACRSSCSRRRALTRDRRARARHRDARRRVSGVARRAHERRADARTGRSRERLAGRRRARGHVAKIYPDARRRRRTRSRA